MMCWPVSMAVPILLKGCRRICRSADHNGGESNTSLWDRHGRLHRPCLSHRDVLSLLKGAGCFPEGEAVTIIDRGSLVRFQALAVEARGVCAVEVGQSIGAADMLKSGVN